MLDVKFCLTFGGHFTLEWGFFYFSFLLAEEGQAESACGLETFLWLPPLTAEPMPEGPPICRKDLYSHPGCGSLFLRRGTEPACKNRPLPLLRLACFCRRQQLGCAATRPLEVPPALRARPIQGLWAVDCSLQALRSAEPEGVGIGFRARFSSIGIVSAKGTVQLKSRRSSCRYRAPPESSGNAAGWRR